MPRITRSRLGAKVLLEPRASAGVARRMFLSHGELMESLSAFSPTDQGESIGPVDVTAYIADEPVFGIIVTTDATFDAVSSLEMALSMESSVIDVAASHVHLWNLPSNMKVGHRWVDFSSLETDFEQDDLDPSSMGAAGPFDWIEGLYEVPDSDVYLFLQRHTNLLSLLIEAPAEVASVFGVGAMLSLELLTDPDDPGFSELFLLISSSLVFQSAIEARAKLDERWWLDRVSAVAGLMNIDVEINE